MRSGRSTLGDPIWSPIEKSLAPTARGATDRQYYWLQFHSMDILNWDVLDAVDGIWDATFNVDDVYDARC